jgi:NAD(P)-dependent dehydrogenase (short-subunit alcohol dehydrogenase family)
MEPVLSDGGAIVNISSLAARLSMANLMACSAVKGSVEAFTHASAKELTPDIRVSTIVYGFVITPQNADTYAEETEKRQRIDERTPQDRVADRDEIVGPATYLTSDATSYVTREVITVDGGFADSMFRSNSFHSDTNLFVLAAPAARYAVRVCRRFRVRTRRRCGLAPRRSTAVLGRYHHW